MPNTEVDVVQHVVVGIVLDDNNNVLVSRRHKNSHQGNKWEFPGGKVEQNEAVYDALCREFDEELGLEIEIATPWFVIQHQYPEKTVCLDIWRVRQFQGVAQGKEGQIVRWVPTSELSVLEFPQANLAIVKALSLPRLYAISAISRLGIEAFFEHLETALQAGLRLLQFREPDLPDRQFLDLATKATDLCHRYDARLLVNANPEVVQRCHADGVHLNGLRLDTLQSRPLDSRLLVAASCHNQAELDKAASLAVDFGVLSPVLPTQTHPGAATLGWQNFASLCNSAGFPLYALGGMNAGQLDNAIDNGAQGVAMISDLWQADSVDRVVRQIMGN